MFAQSARGAILFRDAGTNCLVTLVVPPVRMSSVASRAFQVVGPRIWNDLPANVTSAEPVSAEKSFSEKSRFSVGLNYGPIFRRSWTKVHQIMSADAGEIAVCNAVFRLSMSCSVPEIFAIEVRSRPKSRRKKHVFRSPNFFGEDPRILWT